MTVTQVFFFNLFSFNFFINQNSPPSLFVPPCVQVWRLSPPRRRLLPRAPSVGAPRLASQLVFPAAAGLGSLLVLPRLSPGLGVLALTVLALGELAQGGPADLWPACYARAAYWLSGWRLPRVAGAGWLIKPAGDRAPFPCPFLLPVQAWGGRGFSLRAGRPKAARLFLTLCLPGGRVMPS